MKKLLFTLAAVMLHGILMAQSEPCGYEIYRDHLISRDSNQRYLYYAKKQWVEKYRKEKQADTGSQGSQSFGQMQGLGMPSGGSCDPAKYIIPVVVHIVHLVADNTPGSGTNLSDAQVQHQIDLLNAQFSGSNTDIQFCLARVDGNGDSITGIERYPSSLSTHKMPSEVPNLFSQSSTYAKGFDPNKYLNIYVVQTILNDQGQDGGILGYATVPGAGIHGIVVRHNWFGDYNTCGTCTLDTLSQGKVLAHEVGHYLGLEHTFFQGCTTPDSCSSSGDLCCDTPPCAKLGGCDTTNTCHETYNGDLDDPIHNHMGYNDPLCRNEFTPDQVDVMHAILEHARNELVLPSNVNAMNLECCFLSAFFGADKTFLCRQFATSDTVTFEAYDYEGASYYWEIRDSLGNLITTHNDSVPVFHYLFDTLAAKYSVLLEITGGLDMASLTRSKLVEVADCGSPLASTKGNWFFGEYAGIKFTDKGIVRDIKPFFNKPNAINTSEGTISVSDSNGIMLFHGGGIGSQFGRFYLFDRNYDTMPHGPVIGDGSSTQGGLVIPVPGSSTRYYLVTTSFNFLNNPITQQGLRYSVIDMTLNSGNGDVDSNYKNVIIKAVSGVYANPNDSAFMSGEFITSVPKCNSLDYWLIVGGADSQTVADKGGSPLIYIFSVDSLGITYHDKTDSVSGSVFGQVKVSPNGKYLFQQGALFEFDRIQGKLKRRELFKAVNEYSACSFSPDSRLLYVMVGSPADYPNHTIFQYDLGYNQIELSAKAVGTVPGKIFMSMQLGPDGKIYITRPNQNQLAVIEAPNQRLSVNGSNECLFTTEGPLLSSGGVGGICQQGLPNFSDISDDINALDFVYTDSACGHLKFSPITCSLNNSWIFGDGDSS